MEGIGTKPRPSRLTTMPPERITIFHRFRSGFTGEVCSMRVVDGRVAAYGRDVDAAGAQIVSMDGRWLMPAFTEAHCHILPAGLDLAKLNLTSYASQEEALDAIRERHAALEGGRWLMAIHYDNRRFPEDLHLTRQQLDAISSVRPILLTHSSLHSGVANSPALMEASVTENESDGPSAVYGRNANGKLDGLLIEDAYLRVFRAAPHPNVQEMATAILAAGKIMATRGILCAADLMTGYYDLLEEIAAYRLAAEMGNPVPVRLYAQWGSLFGPRRVNASALKDAVDGLEAVGGRLAGAKIFADGAIASNTAAIYGTYAQGREVGRSLSRHSRSAQDFAPAGVEVSGQLIYSPERLTMMVRTAHEAGMQVSVHSIGDFCTDLVMDAFEALDNPNPHRIEHAMLLSDAQIERMARLGCFCSMQPEFLARAPSPYVAQLGLERAASLIRLRSAADAGIKLSLSSDWPVTTGEPLAGVRAAAQRPAEFDPAENLTPAEALKMYSLGGAETLRETDGGSLSHGQRADFIVFAHDPRELVHPISQVWRAGSRLAEAATA